MKVNLLKMDESVYWSDETRRKVKRIWGVYLFDPHYRVHLCEFAPSFELHRLESQPEFFEETDIATMEQIEDEIREAERFDESIAYMHCYRIDLAKRFIEGFFPPQDMGVCTLHGFATHLRPSRTPRQERHDVGMAQAIEYCGLVQV